MAAGFAGDVDSEVDLAFIGIGNRGNRAACEFARRDRFNAAALADVETGSPRTLGTLKFFSGAARFQGVGPTYWHGEDLDESTYLRRGIALDF